VRVYFFPDRRQHGDFRLPDLEFQGPDSTLNAGDKRLLTNNKEFITSEGCLPTQTTCYLPLATIKFPFSLMLTEIEGLDVLMYRLVPHQKDVYGAQAVETG
jgi:hypothetical protein